MVLMFGGIFMAIAVYVVIKSSGLSPTPTPPNPAPTPKPQGVVTFYTRSGCAPCASMQLTLNHATSRAAMAEANAVLDTVSTPVALSSAGVTATPTCVYAVGGTVMGRRLEGYVLPREFAMWLREVSQ